MMAEVNIMNLPDELIAQILEEVESMHPRFLRVCSEMNHRFYRLCTPLLYRSMSFTFNERVRDMTTSPLYTSFIQKESRVPSYITSISLFNCSPVRDSPELLVKFLKQAKRLRLVRLHGTGYIPEALWRTLDLYCPQAVFEMVMSFKRGSRVPDPPGPGEAWITRIANNQEGANTRVRRYCVRLVPGYVGGMGNRVAVADFVRDTIELSPQLRELTVEEEQLSPPSTRADPYPTELMVDLQVKPGDSYPQIEVLEGLDFTPRAFHEWTVNNGWRYLKRLGIYYHFSSVWWSGRSVETPSLETLIIRTQDDLDKVDRPFCIKGPLKEVILFGNESREPPSQFLGLYGDTLERLVVSPNSAASNNSRQISTQSIILLATNCPKLTTLALCPFADRELPYAFLAHIATTMKSVAQLNVLGYRGSRWGDVEIDSDVMRNLFDFMTANKSGSPIKGLSIGYMNVGDEFGFHTSLSAELATSGELLCRNVYENSQHRQPYEALASKVRQVMVQDNLKRRLNAHAAYRKRQRDFETKHSKHWILFDVLYPRRRNSCIKTEATEDISIL